MGFPAVNYLLIIIRTQQCVRAFIKYSIRLRNKHRGTGLLPEATFLLERVMHGFFSKYPLFDGIGDANFKGYD